MNIESELKMRALGAFAVSLICACGSDRSGLAPGEGAAGQRTDTGVAGAKGAAGANVAGATGSAGVPGAAGAIGVSGAPGAGGAPGASGATGGGSTDAGGAGAAGAGGAAGASLPPASTAGCSADGWCWSTPTPQGNPLYSISGSGASDVWAVGEAGTIVHWDGTSWTQVPSGEHGVLRGVWAASAHDAWAVGDDAVVAHWDGMAWSRLAGVPTTGFHWSAVWGTGPADLWIVGVDMAVSTPDGSGGAMIHWNGAAWTTYTETQPLGAVWGTGPKDVWCLGAARGLFHWNGQAWTMVSDGELPQIGTAIWGSSSSDLWLGGRASARPSHWNGQMLGVGPVDTGPDLNGLWGSGANDVWAVGDGANDAFGDGGTMLHWDGVAWKELPSTGASHLYGVWGSRSDDVWAVGESGDIVHWDGRAWSAPVGPPHVALFSVWGSGPGDVWAFGYDHAGLGALRWDGQTWTKTELLDAATIGAGSGSSAAPYAAWGSGRDDVWVGATDFESNGTTGDSARALFVHWNGHQWSLDKSLDAHLAASMITKSIWGNGPDDVWAVGMVEGDADSTGGAIHWDGMRWSPVTSLSASDLAEPFESVWSSGPNDVWIGGATAVHHWNGVSWSRPVSTQDGGSYLVAGSGPSDVWAVSSAGDDTAAASHWNGVAWQHLAVPGVIGPNSVAAISPTNAWLHSDEEMAHWDGTSWTLSDAGTIFFGSNLWWDGKEIWTVVMRGLMSHP